MQFDDRLPVRAGRFLVELERLERAQDDGVFVADRIDLDPESVAVRDPAGNTHRFPPTAGADDIAAALRASLPRLRAVKHDQTFPWEPAGNPQLQWAQLHYALGAYEEAIFVDFDLRLRTVVRVGPTATIVMLRGREAETSTVDLTSEVDMGLADTIAFRPSRN